MTKRISFVSFKGGAGRSVALANVAYHLAQSGKRVGCVDFDIEAGGLHLIFGVPQAERKQAVQHFLMGPTNYKQCVGTEPPNYEVESEFLKALVVDVVADSLSQQFRESQIPGMMFLLQSRLDPNITAYVDLQNLFNYSDRLLDLFAEHCKLDYLLIDCRAGISRIAFPGLAYTDLMVVCMRWGKQHKTGTIELVRHYRDWSLRMNNDPGVILAATSMTSIRPRATVETFCHDALPAGVPNEVAIIPHFEELVEGDGVVFGSAGSEDNSPYSAFAQAIEKLVSDENE